MLQNKDTSNISELKRTFVDSHKNQKFFDTIIGLLKIGKHHAIFSSVKEKGTPVVQLISICSVFRLSSKKMCMASNKAFGTNMQDAVKMLIIDSKAMPA